MVQSMLPHLLLAQLQLREVLKAYMVGKVLLQTGVAQFWLMLPSSVRTFQVCFLEERPTLCQGPSFLLSVFSLRAK